MCLKVDLYQPKYANIPMSYSVTPCPPGQAFIDGYGVGTVLTATNSFGSLEKITLVEVEPLAKIVFECGPVQMTYTTRLLPNGDCELGYDMDGPHMGRFGRQVTMQLNTLKAFIEANVAAICNVDTTTPRRELASARVPRRSEALLQQETNQRWVPR